MSRLATKYGPYSGASTILQKKGVSVEAEWSDVTVIYGQYTISMLWGNG